MSAPTNTKPARGMRDFLPIEVRKRNYVISIIKEVYESYGFEPLETPSVENLETLTGKYGEEGNQLMFKILKRGEKLQSELNTDEIKSEKDLSDLALRYDLTVPLARVVANHKNDLPKFFKRYQIQPVWRADRPARGRYREFYQCDVDAIGSSSMIVEAELISAVCEILRRLGFTDYAILINNRKLLIGILESYGLSKEEQTKVLIAIDKIDKIGGEGVAKELLDNSIATNFEEFLDTSVDITQRTRKFVQEYLFNKNNPEPLEIISANYRMNKDNLERISEFVVGNEEGKSGIRELEELIEKLKGSSDTPHIFVEPHLARGLSYYTGTIMEIVLANADFKGSIGGGGRYDGLIGMFGKEQIPAVGFSIGLERILLIMEERGMFQKLVDEGQLKLDSADVMITILEKSRTDENDSITQEILISESLKLAAELRKEGLRVLVYPEADKLGKQFKYADSVKVPFVCVLGESELAENTVTLKNLKTGEQEKIERDKLSKEHFLS